MLGKRKKIIFAFLALIMMLQPMLGAGMSVYAQESAEANTPSAEAEKQVKVAIISDIHYVVDSQRTEAGEKALQTSAAGESRMLEEIDTILSVALNQVKDWKPDVVLSCGDLLSNGELLGAQALAKKLKDAKADGLNDTGFYVVNGNHDINNSYAEDFTQDNFWEAQRVLPKDFKENFSGLGYGDTDSYDGSASRHIFYQPSADDPAGSLSYVTEIAEGITLIVLDTAVYTTDTSKVYNEAQKTGGVVSPGLLNWAVQQARSAKAKGNLVFAMSHHALIPHYTEEVPDSHINWAMGMFIVDGWKETANALADAGVSAIFTGHIHSNDIAYYVSDNGNVIYDIQTSALAAYPVSWRMLTIGVNGTGADKSYTFSIETKFLDNDFSGYDTSKWQVNTGTLEEAEYQTFNDYYGGSMQKYSRDKAGGYHKVTINPGVDYWLNNLLYDVVGSSTLEEYLLKNVLKSEKATIKEAIAELIDNNIDKIAGQSFKFKNENEDYELKFLLNAAKDAENSNVITLRLVHVSSNTPYDIGTVYPDLLPDYADRLIKMVDAELDKPDWKTNDYGKANILVNELSALAASVLMPVVTTPLDESENSTVLEIMNDANLTYSRGDEALASDEQKEKWKTWNELLLSDNLKNLLGNKLLEVVGKTIGDKEKYSVLNSFFDLKFAEGSTAKLIDLTVTTSNPEHFSFLNALGLVLYINKLSSLGEIISLVDLIRSFTGMQIIPASLFNRLGEMLSGYQKGFTTDRNIPNDSVWAFRKISFNTRGGSSVTPDSTLTIENGKAAAWPETDPGKANDTFLGWFDAPTGGNQLTKDDDLTGVNGLYAHWESDERQPVPPTPDYPDWFWLLDGELPATGFSAAHVTPLKERPQGLVYGATGFTLQIPKLDVTESIVNVPAADDKYPVEWLGSEVGLLEGSSLPGEGVTVLTGHNHLNTTEIGPFLFLGTLDKGDRLMVSNKQNKVMSYQVYGNYKVASDGFALIADEIHENALILITCEDESVDGGYLNRRVILAEPL